MNTKPEAGDERGRVAEELRRIREAVRDRALLSPEARPAPPARAVRQAEPVPHEAEPEPEPLPTRPDGSAVNAQWEAKPPAGPPGLRGWLARLLRRLLAPSFDAQVAFNARQVQLDNEVLEYVDARLAATHRHYDAVLGIHGRHMGEIDERHLIVQEELVAHVHDLVKRIDFVLAEAERGRLSLEFALKDVRARLARLEERLPHG
jgi:hypothetical protein